MKIYLISGKARHGKDSLANFLKEELDNNGERVCFVRYAAYIKFYAKEYFGWDGEEETKPRELLQHLGTDIIRKQIDPLFHVNRILQDIKVLSFFYDTIIIPDVRTPEEILIPKENFDKVVSINVFRPNFESELNQKEQAHLTEIGLDEFKDYDYKIINDKGLDELKDKALEIIESERMKDGEE